MYCYSTDQRCHSTCHVHRQTAVHVHVPTGTLIYLLTELVGRLDCGNPRPSRARPAPGWSITECTSSTTAGSMVLTSESAAIHAPGPPQCRYCRAQKRAPSAATSGPRASPAHDACLPQESGGPGLGAACKLESGNCMPYATAPAEASELGTGTGKRIPTVSASCSRG